MFIYFIEPSDDEISDIEEENEANKATEVELDYALEMAYKDELEDDTGETEDKIVDKESEDEDASEEEAPATDEKTKKRLQEVSVSFMMKIWFISLMFIISK